MNDYPRAEEILGQTREIKPPVYLQPKWRRTRHSEDRARKWAMVIMLVFTASALTMVGVIIALALFLPKGVG